jgi:hypothetical protein
VRTRVLDHAHGRSGDKLDRANIGIVARSPQDFEMLVAQLTPERVGPYLSQFLGPVVVRRYVIASIRGMNFVVEHALDGGSLSSRRLDRLAKAMSGTLLSMPMNYPDAGTDQDA